MKEQLVTGCNDCPCCDMNDMSVGYSCNLDKDIQIPVDSMYMPVTPSYCPLKEAPVTLVFIT